MSTEGLGDVKVGDPLILATGNRHRDDESVTVSRIGRQYLYVAVNGREKRERFDRKTGVEANQRGIQARLYTQEQCDEMRRRSALLTNLREAGIDVRHEARADMSTDTLRALLAAVQPKAS